MMMHVDDSFQKLCTDVECERKRSGVESTERWRLAELTPGQWVMWVMGPAVWHI